MKDWSPEHHGQGRYRRKWLARIFDAILFGIAIGSVSFIVFKALSWGPWR